MPAYGHCSHRSWDCLITAKLDCLWCVNSACTEHQNSFLYLFMGSSSNIKEMKNKWITKNRNKKHSCTCYTHPGSFACRLVSANLRQKLMIDSIWNGIHKIYSTNHSYNIRLLVYIAKEWSLFAHALLTTWSLELCLRKAADGNDWIIKRLQGKNWANKSLMSWFREMLNSHKFYWRTWEIEIPGPYIYTHKNTHAIYHMYVSVHAWMLIYTYGIQCH